MRSTLFPSFPEHALRSAQGNQEREIVCTHPTPRADQSTTAAARSQHPQRPVDKAPHFGSPQSKGGPSPRRCDIPAPRPESTNAVLVPHPPPRGSAEKAPSAKPACIRPAPPAPSLTPSHAPEPTGATTHPASPGRGSPGRRGGGASPESEAARQLRQVSSSWILLLLPVAANTRAPPASVPLPRCSPPRLL